MTSVTIYLSDKYIGQTGLIETVVQTILRTSLTWEIMKPKRFILNSFLLIYFNDQSLLDGNIARSRESKYCYKLRHRIQSETVVKVLEKAGSAY